METVNGAKARKARSSIEALSIELDKARNELAECEARCCHDWSDTESAHIYHDGYTIPGDAPGTHGVDWRGSVYVPPSANLRWKRTCRTCGKEEFTSAFEVEKKETYKPRF